MAGYVIPYSPAKLSGAAASGKEGVTHPGGQVHQRRGLTDATAPTRTQFAIAEERLAYDRAWYAVGQLLVETIATPLKVGVTAGAYTRSDGTVVEYAGIAAYPAASTLPDATSGVKLWIDTASNAVTHGTAWPADPSAYIPLCELDTAGGGIGEGTLRGRRPLLAVAPPRPLTALIAVEDLAAGADIAARPVFVRPDAPAALLSVGILTRGAPAGIDDANTCVVALKDDAGNTIVSKTYNTANQPPNGDYASLGVLSATHRLLEAGEHCTLDVTQGATADLPAFTLVIGYV